MGAAGKRVVEWSSYQKAIFDDVAHGTGHTAVIARAGSSKTTVLVESLKHLPRFRGRKVLCVAFNRSIAAELSVRVPNTSIEKRTLHSLGFSIIRRHMGKVSIDPTKAKAIIRGTFPEGYNCWEELYSIDRMVSLCKSSLIDTRTDIDRLMDEHDIVPVSLTREQFVRRVFDVLELSRSKTDSVNFDDMIWFVHVHNLPIPQYDYVLVDETQDLAPAQIELALSCVKPTGRIFVLGDPRQSLYGWLGADIRTVDRIVKRLDAKVLNLPISYRCPRSVIKLTQKMVPDIQAAPNAIEGRVSYATADQLVTLVRPGDFIISRTNAPLVRYCMELIRHRIPANIRGRDVSVSLKALVKKSGKKDVTAFRQWLDRWRDDEVARLKEKRRSTESVADIHECLTILTSDLDEMSELDGRMKRMFGEKDKRGIVVLGTSHRMKGGESQNVFVLRWTFRPEESEAEENCLYVAVTRSLSTLTLVSKV